MLHMQTARLRNNSHGPVVFSGKGIIDNSIGTLPNKRLQIRDRCLGVAIKSVECGKQTRVISKANANICALCIVYSDIHSIYPLANKNKWNESENAIQLSLYHTHTHEKKTNK